MISSSEQQAPQLARMEAARGGRHSNSKASLPQRHGMELRRLIPQREEQPDTTAEVSSGRLTREPLPPLTTG